MEAFEWILILLVVAVLLTSIARRIGVPYPSLLALGGTALALLPSAPEFRLDPELTLALFVAPVLLDSAYDTSLRDLRRNWIPVTCLVLAAVGLTTIAVAWVAHALVPGMPWGAAIALGAIVAPPDAAAASAVLKQLQLPHRVLVILEGESLLNDASALLIYRLAVMAVASGGLELTQVAPTFALSVVGSVIAGYLLARVSMMMLTQVEDASSAIVLQFAGTFGVWILADRAGLSAIVTVVVYAVTLARDAPRLTPARQRIPSYAVWETAVFVLNVLAFVLIGLQLRPILSALDATERVEYFQVAMAVLGTVVAIRIVWVSIYNSFARFKMRLFGSGNWPGANPPTIKGSVLISWCGMRGIVTLAAAYALPVASQGRPEFPYRDLILLCAFCVVVGTLVVQGLTLRPLIIWLGLKDDRPVDREVRLINERMTQVALASLDGDASAESEMLRREFVSLLNGSSTLDDAPHGQSRHDELRATVIAAQRRILLEMRASDEIGDDAFHQIEERLDWAELNARGMGR
ncbi:MAG TPA: sodium:proton antiporter [Steroidobacteraceae bacterium]|jgi:CPA1 family monovalent cation:H+ antiporter